MLNPKDSRVQPGDTARKLQHLDLLAKENADHKAQVYAWMDVQPGHRVLDVGCGAGADTLRLAQLVGPTGQVVGIDVDEAIITRANERAAEAGVSSWVEHRIADAAEIPFEDNTFDACHSERVFMHLLDPDRAFAEIARVTKPGGRVAITEPDGGTISIDTPEVEIERQVVQGWAARHNNPYAGRQLYRLFRTHGMGDIHVDTRVFCLTDMELFNYLLRADEVLARLLGAGTLTEEQVQRYRSSTEEAARAGAFFATTLNVTVVGRKR